MKPCRGILKAGEAGLPLADLVRKHGISRPANFSWKSYCAGATIADGTRMEVVEAENANPKRMYADLARENTAIEDVMASVVPTYGQDCRSARF